MSNIYIEQGILQDCQNDRNIILSMRGMIHEVILKANKLKQDEAMAYNSNMLDDIIHHMDDALWKAIRPVEDLADEGEQHHERASNA